MTLPDLEIDESHLELALPNTEQLSLLLTRYTSVLSSGFLASAISRGFNGCVEFLLERQTFAISVDLLESAARC